MSSKKPPDPTYVLRGIKVPVNDLHLKCKDDKQHIFCGRSDGTLELWDLDKKRVETTIDGHVGSSINAVGSLYNKYFFSHGRDGKVKVWDLAASREDVVSSFTAKLTNFCKACSFDCDQESAISNEVRRWLVGPGTDSEIWVKNALTGQDITKLNPVKEDRAGMCMFTKCIISQQSMRPLILAGYEGGNIILWDVSEHKPLAQAKCFDEPVTCIDLNSAHTSGVVGSVEKEIATIEIKNMDSIYVNSSAIVITNPGINDVRIRSDDKLVATGGWDGRIRLFSMKSQKALAVLTYHNEGITRLAFSSKDIPKAERLLVAGSRDGRISLWSIYN